MVRPSKVVSIGEAVTAVTQGCSVAIGGFLLHNKPSAFVRELVRTGVSDLHLYACPTSSYDADLLIGAGLVAETVIAMASFEYLGPAPRFTAAMLSGAVEMVECDEVTIAGGLLATIEGIPYHPVVSARGHDVARRSKLVTPYRSHTGHDLVAVAPLRPDVAVVHVQEADAYGNARHLGGRWGDEMLIKASRHVILTCDRLIDNAEVRRNPWATTIPGYLVDAVVPLPFGAHPCSSHGKYLQDEAHLSGYLEAAQTDAGFASYLDTYVHGVGSHQDYLDRVGAERLESLRWEFPG